MRVLLDQGTPVPLREFLTSHRVETAYERGWSDLSNGRLIRAAEDEGFEVLVTTDSHIKFQQNLANRNLAIVVLRSASWPRLRKHIAAVIAGIDAATAGTVVEISIPHET